VPSSETRRTTFVAFGHGAPDVMSTTYTPAADELHVGADDEPEHAARQSAAAAIEGKTSSDAIEVAAVHGAFHLSWSTPTVSTVEA
jgi:hypothetical protein